LLTKLPKGPKCHFLGTVLVQFAERGGTIAILPKLGQPVLQGLWLAFGTVLARLVGGGGINSFEGLYALE
jgi:hypothetical protein